MMEYICGKKDSYTDMISYLQGKNIVLYGAGGIGYLTSIILKDKGCSILKFIDDDIAKQGTYINGIKVVSLEDIDSNSTFTILISLPNPINVYKKLIDIGFNDVQYYPVMMGERNFYDVPLIEENLTKIKRLNNLLADDISKLVFNKILEHRKTMDFTYFDNIISPKQYFPYDLFSLSDTECFVDGGAYNGETMMEFIIETKNKFNYIYAFEPDIDNYIKIIDGIKLIDHNRINVFNTGLYSFSGEIHFNSHGNSASYISETGEDKISVTKLDEIIADHKPTYIKLDIEGAEEQALYGMKETIQKYHPKLAISIYHKATDLWKLPLLIHNLSDSYKIYIRHYSNGLHETVCYAI